MSPAPAEKKPVYIESPGTEDLLDEQYAWLRVHSERCNHVAGCEHCLRMIRLKAILMQPFHEEKYYSVQIAKRKARESFIKNSKGAGKA